MYLPVSCETPLASRCVYLVVSVFVQVLRVRGFENVFLLCPSIKNVELELEYVVGLLMTGVIYGQTSLQFYSTCVCIKQCCLDAFQFFTWGDFFQKT